jgi:uncharacterized membrane-anchored protein
MKLSEATEPKPTFKSLISRMQIFKQNYSNAFNAYNYNKSTAYTELVVLKKELTKFAKDNKKNPEVSQKLHSQIKEVIKYFTGRIKELDVRYKEQKEREKNLKQHGRSSSYLDNKLRAR